MVSTYRVAVLGARGVGKSAIVRQFLYNEFSEVCVPTTTRRLYLPAVVMNGHVHDLQILDFPPISAFPVNTLQVSSLGNRQWGRGDYTLTPQLWPHRQEPYATPWASLLKAILRRCSLCASEFRRRLMNV